MSLHPSGDQVGRDKVAGDKVAGNKIAVSEVKGDLILQSSASLTAEERENRRAMLDKVRLIWIKGVLQKSLWQEARLDLPLAAQPGAVQRPYHLVARGPDGYQSLPDGTRIADVYAEHLGVLLILGAPGGGKTTLLLELADTLIDQAIGVLDRGEAPLLPVVFNLASWADGRLPLSDWLTRELNTQYQVPRKLAQRWVAEQTILLLLDGLDEVAASARTACATAINTYRQELGGLRPLIVCCRVQEYSELGTALTLHGAVLALPLRREQIEDTLAAGGERLVGIRVALAQDAALWELLETPLMLSIVVLTFEDQPASALPSGDDQGLRRLLFARYVERMLDRKGDNARYPREQTLRWLTWLATRMQEQGLSMYQIETMQPGWLAWTAQGLRYRILSVLIFALLFGLFLGLAFGLLFGLAFGLALGLFAGLFGGLSFGLVGGLALLEIVAPIQRVQWSWQVLRRWRLLKQLLGQSVALGFRVDQIITPVERVRWSWQAARQRWWLVLRQTLVTGLIFGLLLGLIVQLVNGFRDGLVFGLALILIFGLSLMLVFGLGIGLLFWLLSGLVTGFQSLQIDHRSRPNQGIRRSVRSGLLLGLFGGLLFGVALGLIVGALGGLIFEQVNGLLFGLGIALIFGLFGGPLTGLRFGWGAVIQHYTLRWLLWRSGAFPRDIAAFCDSCVTRILLRRVGGGWIFVHRLLLEYFAELEEENMNPAE
jgi:hypothetical protein